MVAIGNASLAGLFVRNLQHLFAQLIGERRVEVRGAVCLNASLEITASTDRLSWLNACRHDRCDYWAPFQVSVVIKRRTSSSRNQRSTKLVSKLLSIGQTGEAPA
jgi:hypothetical protein